MTIRVVLAEDNALLRQGLARLIESRPDLELVGSAEDLPTLLALDEELAPDVVVTDIRMPPTGTDEGIRAAAEIKTRRPDTGVVVLSQYAEPRYALALLEAGSDGRGYLLKERVHDATQIRSAVQTVAEGGSVIDPKVVELLVTASAHAEASPLVELTQREREVLSEIAQGKSNAAIGASLSLTKLSVEKHINSIFLKLNLANVESVSKRVKAALLFLADEDAVEARS